MEYEERSFRFGDSIEASVRLLSEFKGKQFDAKQQGLFLWPGAERFCQYAASHPDTFARKRVIELGAGSGLGSAVVAHLGPEQLMVTDGSEQVMDLLRQNIDINLAKCSEKSIKDKVQVFLLEWSEDEESVKRAQDNEGRQLHKAFDVVFGSDLIYEYANIVRLLTTVKGLLSDDKNAFFVLSYVHRSDYLWSEIQRHAKEIGLTCDVEDEGSIGGLPSRILIFRKTNL